MTLPKLNLRDLFWLVVVVAMGVGWWIDSSRKSSRCKQLQDESFVADERYEFLRHQVLEADWKRKFSEDQRKMSSVSPVEASDFSRP
jgi:hypothetical protein